MQTAVKLVFGDPMSIAARDRQAGNRKGVPDRTTSYWRIKSREVIAEVLAANPETGRDELRKRLSAAYPFGQRKYTPYKLWLQEVRAALAMIDAGGQ